MEFEVLEETIGEEIEVEEVKEPDFSRAEYYPEDENERRNQLLERLRLKSKILAYKQKFPDELIVYDYKMENLDKYSIEDMEVFLDEIKLVVTQRNSLNMTKSMYFGGLEFVEKTSSAMGYDINGLSKMLYSQKEVHKCLDEISLEYEDELYMPAYIRLPYITLQCALTLYQQKKVENIVQNEMDKNVKKEILEEYSDL